MSTRQNRTFFSPPSLGEALNLLQEHAGRAQVLGGGTDVMPRINAGQVAPECLIHIGCCGLGGISESETELIIGSGTTFTQILKSAAVQTNAPLLARVAGTIGDRAIRNMATIGGNLVNASPAGDSMVALLALDARLKIVSLHDERMIDLDDFFIGPGRTVLKPAEILVSVHIPLVTRNWRYSHYKLGRRRGHVCSIISTAVTACLREGVLEQVRIALGAVAPRPILAHRAREILTGNRPDPDLFDQAAELAAGETAPIDDGRATAWYRKRMARVLVRRLLLEITE